MPSLDVGPYLEDTRLMLTGIASRKHPDGHAYEAADLTWSDTLLIRQLMPVLSSLELPDGVTQADVQTILDSLLTDPDGREVTFQEKLLGGSYVQMVDDGVSAIAFDRITAVLLRRHGYGENAAVALSLAMAKAATAEPTRSPVEKSTPAKKASPAKRVASDRASSPTEAAKSAKARQPR